MLPIETHLNIIIYCAKCNQSLVNLFQTESIIQIILLNTFLAINKFVK